MKMILKNRAGLVGIKAKLKPVHLGCIFICFLISSTFSFASVKLPDIFSDHMLLQRSSEVNIWGWANPSEKISVRGTWSQQIYTTSAGEDGKWMIKIKTPESGQSQELVVSGENEIRIKDVLIGEVWLCSGQSNMVWPMERTDEYKLEPKNVNRELRYFEAKKLTSPNTTEVEGRWIVVNQKTLGQLSAVGYHFSKNLNRSLQCPIGIIVNAYGGSTIESWISREVLEKQSFFRPVLQDFDRMLKDMDSLMLKHENTVIKDWNKQVTESNKKGVEPPTKPRNPEPTNQHRPSHCYNAMLYGIIPYTIKGILWYQGESNAGRGKQYEQLLPILINSWRKEWDQGDLPFYIALLAPHVSQQPMDMHKAEIRLAQVEVANRTNNCEIISTMDVGNLTDIHPRKKQLVGERFTKMALGEVYKTKGSSPHGPKLSKMQLQGDHVKLSFDHAKKLICTSDTLKGFQIAGLDGIYRMAEATIYGKTIKVFSAEVKKPLNVRFALYDAAEVFVYNESNIPMLPFRTDSFEWQSESNFLPPYLREYLYDKE
ncbi:sialate O-acetylesterase [Cellulophaga sp. L1A9]|uniref:sialate O-acetylesterase n=1 Tax=Cellulophaga sp. L1A9 TaxID=2686362 RepID=UPI00131C2D7C|nr:sialate O-acetylesterase [Cellulophaga sp. L1A9]